MWLRARRAPLRSSALPPRRRRRAWAALRRASRHGAFSAAVVALPVVARDGGWICSSPPQPRRGVAESAHRQAQLGRTGVSGGLHQPPAPAPGHAAGRRSPPRPSGPPRARTSPSAPRRPGAPRAPPRGGARRTAPCARAARTRSTAPGRTSSSPPRTLAATTDGRVQRGVPVLDVSVAVARATASRRSRRPRRRRVRRCAAARRPRPRRPRVSSTPGPPSQAVCGTPTPTTTDVGLEPSPSTRWTTPGSTPSTRAPRRRSTAGPPRRHPCAPHLAPAGPRRAARPAPPPRRPGSPRAHGGRRHLRPDPARPRRRPAERRAAARRAARSESSIVRSTCWSAPGSRSGRAPVASTVASTAIVPPSVSTAPALRPVRPHAEQQLDVERGPVGVEGGVVGLAAQDRLGQRRTVVRRVLLRPDRVSRPAYPCWRSAVTVWSPASPAPTTTTRGSSPVHRRATLTVARLQRPRDRSPRELAISSTARRSTCLACGHISLLPVARRCLTPDGSGRSTACASERPDLRGSPDLRRMGPSVVRTSRRNTARRRSQSKRRATAHARPRPGHHGGCREVRPVVRPAGLLLRAPTRPTTRREVGASLRGRGRRPDRDASRAHGLHHLDRAPAQARVSSRSTDLRAPPSRPARDPSGPLPRRSGPGRVPVAFLGLSTPRNIAFIRPDRCSLCKRVTIHVICEACRFLVTPVTSAPVVTTVTPVLVSGGGHFPAASGRTVRRGRETRVRAAPSPIEDRSMLSCSSHSPHRPLPVPPRPTRLPAGTARRPQRRPAHAARTPAARLAHGIGVPLLLAGLVTAGSPGWGIVHHPARRHAQRHRRSATTRRSPARQGERAAGQRQPDLRRRGAARCPAAGGSAAAAARTVAQPPGRRAATR